MTFFFNMIDVAGIAAYVIWRTKNPQWNNNKRHRRRIFLQQLGRSVVDSYLNQRSKNPQAVQQALDDNAVMFVHENAIKKLPLDVQLAIFLAIRIIIK